jgi:hypothetical protein
MLDTEVEIEVVVEYTRLYIYVDLRVSRPRGLL